MEDEPSWGRSIDCIRGRALQVTVKDFIEATKESPYPPGYGRSSIAPPATCALSYYILERAFGVAWPVLVDGGPAMVPGGEGVYRAQIHVKEVTL